MENNADEIIDVFISESHVPQDVSCLVDTSTDDELILDTSGLLPDPRPISPIFPRLLINDDISTTKSSHNPNEGEFEAANALSTSVDVLSNSHISDEGDFNEASLPSSQRDANTTSRHCDSIVVCGNQSNISQEQFNCGSEYVSDTNNDFVNFNSVCASNYEPPNVHGKRLSSDRPPDDYLSPFSPLCPSDYNDDLQDTSTESSEALSLHDSNEILPYHDSTRPAADGYISGSDFSANDIHQDAEAGVGSNEAVAAFSNTKRPHSQVSGSSQCRARTSKRRKFVMRPKCIKHGVFVGLSGCKFCNLPANNVSSTNASPPHSDACGSPISSTLHVGDSNQSSAYDLNVQEKLPCPSFCEKCLRTNTSLYPLNLVTIPQSVVHRTKFGQHLDSRKSHSFVCGLCFDYITCDNFWGYAWPSVLCTLLFQPHKFHSDQKHLFEILPNTIQLSYSYHMGHFDPLCCPTVGLMRDVTSDFGRFQQMIRSYKASSLVLALNEFCFPDIRCPAGCFEFIERVGFISFAHFLNWLYPHFTSFAGNARVTLKGCRVDFFKPLMFLNVFTVKAAVFSSVGKGLMLVTCNDHRDGLPLNYVHVPFNPAVGNVSSPLGDRLAPLVPTVRTVTPGKRGQKSATFTMCKVDSGRVGGVSSTFLKSDRSLAVNDCPVLQNVESLAIQNRRDLRLQLVDWANSEAISMRFAEKMLSKMPDVNKERLNECMQVGTAFDTRSLMLMKEFSERCPDTFNVDMSLPLALEYGHVFHSFGNTPIQICQSVSSSPFLFNFLLCVLNINVVWEQLARVSQTNHSVKDVCLKIHRLNMACRRNRVFNQCSLVSEIECAFPNVAVGDHYTYWNTLFLSFPKVVVLHVPRQYMEAGQLPLSDANVEAVVFCAGSMTSRPHAVPEYKCLLAGTTLRLVYLANGSAAALRRSSGLEVMWFIDGYSPPCKNVDLSCFERNWTVAVYLRIPSQSCQSVKRFLGFLGGQSVFTCEQHEMILTIDFRDSSKTCSIMTNNRPCNRKSAWRCPSPGCLASVCRRHFSSLSESSRDVLISDLRSDLEPSPVRSVSSADECFIPLSPSEPHFPSDDENLDEFNSFLMIDSGLQNNECLSSNAGAQAIQLSDDAKTVPLHILLNGECSVFKRIKHPQVTGKRFKRFFQNFVSATPGKSFPFLQPEGALFPSIFYKQLDDGSYLGALPFFLYDDRAHNSNYGYDGVHEHTLVRLKDHSLLTSTTLAYLMYSFDTILNLSLTKHHSNEFFKRGLQNITIGNEKPHQNIEKGPVLHMDSVDSDIHVNRLTAACASETPTLFVTLTCNQKDHPGVAPLMKALNEQFGYQPGEQLRMNVEAYMSVILRCWTRTVELLLKYLQLLEEHILGDIVKLWARSEFQSLSANLQHYHMLLWLRNTDSEIEHFIQCAHKHVMHAFRKLVQTDLGLVDNHQQAERLFEDCINIQTHYCSKKNKRCHKKTNVNGEKVCRFPPYPQSHVMWYKEFNQHHTEDVFRILKDIGLAEKRPGFDRDFQVKEVLRAGKFMYAASLGEHMSPLNVSLWAIVRSSINVLKICHSMASKYLTSYAAGKEEHAEVTFRPTNFTSVSADCKNLENKKIGGVRRILQQENTRQSAHEISHTTTIAVTECVSWLLQIPAVITSMDFVSVPSVPLENRGGFLLQNRKRAHDVTVRSKSLNLPLHRQFTKSQVVVLESQKQSRFTTDKVTVFSLRPPELLHVNKLRNYFEWFVRESLPISEGENAHLKYVHLNIERSCWVDAEGLVVRLRPCAVWEYIDYVRFKTMDPFADVRVAEASSLVESVLVTKSLPSFLSFVSQDICLSNTPAEVVFSKVLPQNPANFLFHLLLTSAEFETELDLLNVPTFRDAFVKGGLLEKKDAYTVADVNTLLKRYVLQELRFLPGGSRSFDNNVVAVKEALTGLIIYNDIYSSSIPKATMTLLTEEMEERIRGALRDSQMSLIKNVVRHRFPNYPNLEDFNRLSKENPSTWSPLLPRGIFQSNTSYVEQQKIINLLKQKIDETGTFRRKFLKHELVLGPPGTGKTYVLTVALAYALARGLFCFVTSLASRRASQFGGEHIHRIFCLPTVVNASPVTIAEQALQKLDRKNEKKCILLAIEVLFVEEISLISAEQWSAMDIILQQLRSCSFPFGGILVIASGDQMQLPAIQGREIFLSPILLTNFHLRFLSDFVRMTDLAGQRLLTLMWGRPIQLEKANEIVDIISSHCNFVPDWNSLKDETVMRVFGKRTAERKEFRKHLDSIRNSRRPFLIVGATDEVCLAKSSSWNKTTSQEIKALLDKRVNEPHQLVLYKGALVRITVNMEDLNISQGQVAIIHELPTQSNALHLYIPPWNIDSTNITPETISSELYLAWRKITVYKTQGFIQYYKSNSVRRIQYPLMNFVAMTVHKLMGDTLSKLATSISMWDATYSLWLVSQLFVIISRVKELHNLTFVGCKRATLAAIHCLLLKNDRREQHLFDILQNLRNRDECLPAPAISTSVFSYVPFHREIPATEHGYLYLLVSLADDKLKTFYAGQTNQPLLACLAEHNSGNGPAVTDQPHLLPWAIAAFAFNFSSAAIRNHFLLSIQHNMDVQKFSKLSTAIAFIETKLQAEAPNVRFCVCGRTEPSITF